MDFDNVRGILKKCTEIFPRGSHVGRGIFSKIAWAWHRGIPRPTRGVISTHNQPPNFGNEILILGLVMSIGITYPYGYEILLKGLI